MIFVCWRGEHNDPSVATDLDPHHAAPRRLNSLNRGGNVSLSECERSAAHWGLQGQLSEVVRKGLVGIGHPMRILPLLHRADESHRGSSSKRPYRGSAENNSFSSSFVRTCPAIVGGVEEIAREPLLHCIFRPAAGTGDEPTNSQATLGPHPSKYWAPPNASYLQYTSNTGMMRQAEGARKAQCLRVHTAPSRYRLITDSAGA